MLQAWIVTSLVYGLCWLVVVWLWYRTWRFNGGIRLGDVGRVLLYTWRSQRRWIFLACLLLPLWPIGVWLRTGVSFPPLGWFVIVMTSLTTLLWMLRPPSILFLGPSNWRTKRLYLELKSRTAGLRMVALLNRGDRPDDRLGPGESVLFEADNWRTRNDQDWQSVVHFVMDRVPLVIVDTRFPSPAV